MPNSKNSLISVVIPNYNGRQILEKHLPHVIAAIRDKDEIIVVDDASTDDSISWLKRKYPKVKVVEHHKNLRFATTINSGVKQAKNKIVILLNNDVSPQKNFLKNLLTHFSDNQVFAVGCKEIQILNNKKTESGRSQGKFHRGFLIHWRAQNQNKPNTLWAAGGSMAINKSIFDQLGGMDELYKPAYWEDIDLSYRAQKRGFKVLFEPKSIVHHHHETTNIKELGNLLMQLSAYKNQFLFVYKNITDFKLILQHFLWLPYNLIVTTIRSKGLFFLGFIWALIQLPQALIKRKQEKRLSQQTDSQVLNSIN